MSAGADPLLAWGIVSRGIGLVYTIAFFSMARDIRGLAGRDGIAPFAPMLAQIKFDLGIWRHRYFPSIFHFTGASDLALLLLPTLGAAAGLAVVLGFGSSRLAFAFCAVAMRSLDLPVPAPLLVHVRCIIVRRIDTMPRPSDRYRPLPASHGCTHMLFTLPPLAARGTCAHRSATLAGGVSLPMGLSSIRGRRPRHAASPTTAPLLRPAARYFHGRGSAHRHGSVQRARHGSGHALDILSAAAVRGLRFSMAPRARAARIRQEEIRRHGT